MSVASEIQRLQGAKSDLATAIAAKGVTVPAGTKIDGYATLVGQIQTGSSPNLQSLNVTPSTQAQQITPTSPVDGYDEVNVAAVTSAIDQNIAAGNIKKNVSILGVTGTLESGYAEAEDNDVIFIDYDGTIRYSYSKADFLNLTELPPNPTHPGLTSQGWNWTLADAKTYVTNSGILVIGQNYITSDGKTRFYLHNETHALTIALYFSQTVSEGVTIDWGDGSATETIAGTGNVNTQHIYANPGDYVLALNCTSGTMALGNGTQESPTLGGNGKRVLFKVELGANVTTKIYAFHNYRALRTITTPSSYREILGETFDSCSSLQAIVLSKGGSSANIGSANALYNCPNLRYISFPSALSNIPANSIKNCGGLKKIAIPSLTEFKEGILYGCGTLSTVGIPSNLQTLGLNCFAADYILQRVVLPSTVATINGGAFYNNNALREVILYATTPPNLKKTDAFAGTHGDLKIYVPYSEEHTVLANYKAASNWLSYESKIFELDENGNIPTT